MGHFRCVYDIRMHLSCALFDQPFIPVCSSKGCCCGGNAAGPNCTRLPPSTTLDPTQQHTLLQSYSKAVPGAEMSNSGRMHPLSPLCSTPTISGDGALGYGTAISTAPNTLDGRSAAGLHCSGEGTRLQEQQQLPPTHDILRIIAAILQGLQVHPATRLHHLCARCQMSEQADIFPWCSLSHH